MLKDLLDAAGVPYTEHGFTLDGTFYSRVPYPVSPDPVLVRDTLTNSCFWILAWDSFGNSTFTPCEFGFLSEDHLVISVKDVRPLCDRDGGILTGVVGPTDRRILNRLRARELLK